mmetsp:Transcript_17026/g.44188  ORF Transcript_17026/g.44188 Transcript_17026/m.44188 type:complete len:268 (+) Transcript_17026:596-1399(+)
MTKCRRCFKMVTRNSPSVFSPRLVVAQECSRLVEVAAEQCHADPRDGEWAARERGCIFQPLPVAQAEPSAPAAAFRTDARAYGTARATRPCSPAARDILLGARMAELVGAVLGRPAYLYNDQYIVKPARSSLASFRWHRDSDWCRSGQFTYAPYISVWCALDDMTLGNGTLVVAPRGGAWSAQPSGAPAGGPSLAGNGGGDPGLRPLAVRAGDAVVMDDMVWHASGPNGSAFARRAWMPQFSAGPICHTGSGQPVSLAVPLVSGGGA